MEELNILTSESVTEGHPDKVCDYISDSILDAYLSQDKLSHVACETMCKTDTVVLGGEVTSRGNVDLEQVVREAIREIGYTDPDSPFNADGVRVVRLLTSQSPEINAAVNADPGRKDQGAGDQGMMFGYASDETEELMPLSILLAHNLSYGMREDRKQGRIPWLKPDGKTQVSVVYEDGRPTRVDAVLVSTQHDDGITHETITDYVREALMPRILGDWMNKDIRVIVNPSGSFVLGGPEADSGLTGRKIIVDTYGGAARHGGGAFSGKDPSKVDRSAAYFARHAARRIVREGLAHRAEIQVAYAIGVAQPVSLLVNTYGTGDEAEACRFLRTLDFRPQAIIEQLDLLRPIYRNTTNYGHFGRSGLPWED